MSNADDVMSTAVLEERESKREREITWLRPTVRTFLRVSAASAVDYATHNGSVPTDGIRSPTWSRRKVGSDRSASRAKIILRVQK